MKIILTLMVFCSLPVWLSGCVLAVGNESPGSVSVARPMMAEIARLELGTSYDSVLDQFGAPYTSRAYPIEAGECRVLSYLVENEIQANEQIIAISLVFENGKLLSWGKRAGNAACGIRH